MAADERRNWMSIRTDEDELISVAAWGDWHPDVPQGQVVVCAVPRGSAHRPVRENSQGGKYFLVSAAAYAPGLAIDPQQHAEAKAFVPMRMTNRRSGDAQPSQSATSSTAASHGGQLSRPDSGSAGQARPWREVLGELGISKSAGAPSAGAGTGAQPRPWSEVFRELGVSTKTELQGAAGEWIGVYSR
jgi:hypothetical protein